MNFIEKVLSKVTRSRALTACGVTVAVTSAVSPQLFEGAPRVQAAVITAGAVAAAVGRALLASSAAASPSDHPQGN